MSDAVFRWLVDRITGAVRQKVKGLSPKKLGDRQRLFGLLVGVLLLHVYATGGSVSIAWAYRPPHEAKRLGDSRSNHIRKLAIDLNLFLKIDGEWVFQRTTEAHAKLGKLWKSLHPLCCWGGDFPGKRKDGNHYSIEYAGHK